MPSGWDSKKGKVTMIDRLKKIQEIRESLREGRPTVGTWMQIPHPSVAEILGQAGYDWVAVDMEHGTVSASQLPDLFRALELGGTLPLVRLAQGHPKDCKRALDAGAGGVIVPMVESAQQLREVRDACKWPPAGTRGVGFSRANLFGKHFSVYQEEAQQPLLVAMIEHFKKGKISLEKIVEKMCHNPSILFQIEKRGFVKEGFKADLVLVDLDDEFTVSKENILYKCGWSPLEGTTFHSKITHTFVNGNLVFENGKFSEETFGERLLFER